MRNRCKIVIVASFIILLILLAMFIFMFFIHGHLSQYGTNGSNYVWHYSSNNLHTSDTITVMTTPFGYYESLRDTTGNYDHCFSYKTDPEYGVEIQNRTHILGLDCEWTASDNPP